MLLMGTLGWELPSAFDMKQWDRSKTTLVDTSGWAGGRCCWWQVLLVAGLEPQRAQALIPYLVILDWDLILLPGSDTLIHYVCAFGSTCKRCALFTAEYHPLSGSLGASTFPNVCSF